MKIFKEGLRGERLEFVTCYFKILNQRFVNWLEGELPKDLSSERQSNVSLGHSILYLSLPILLIIQHSSEKYLLNQKRNFCLICL